MPGFLQGLALGWGRIGHLLASCPLFPECGELWPCLRPTPLALILTLQLLVIPLVLSFLGGRRGREAARLGIGSGGGSWSNKPWRNGCSSMDASAEFSSPPPLLAAERGGALGPGVLFQMMVEISRLMAPMGCIQLEGQL